MSKQPILPFRPFSVAVGETKKVTFTLDPRDLSTVTKEGEHVVLPGRYSVAVGSRQPGEGSPYVLGHFDITGEKKLRR